MEPFGLIARERLARDVSDALARGGPVMLTAGAGFGKTTLLQQVAAVGGEPVAWLRCRVDAGDPGLLVTRMLDAIAAVLPGAIDAPREQRAESLEGIDASGALAALGAQLSREPVHPVVLVIDGAEKLADAPECVRLLAGLVDDVVPGLNVALATRHGLPIPLARLRAEGRLTELGPAELRFGAAECAALLTVRTGLDPSPERVEEIMEATYGWPLGVSLAAGLVSRDLAGAAGLRSYLDEELFRSLPSALREAALRASVAGRVSPRVAGALELPVEFREELEHAGFLLEVDGDRTSFAFHPLLLGFLRERARVELDEAGLRELNAVVAPAVEEDGDPNAAIEHWLAAESWPEAAAAIEREGLGLVRSRPALVGDWIARLPKAQQERPALRGLEGQSWWLAGNNARALPELRAAVRGFAEHSDPFAEWVTRSVMVDALFATGEPDGIAAAIEGWDSPDAAGAYALPSAAAMFAAVGLASYARFDESERLARAALASEHSEMLGPFDALRRIFLDLPGGAVDEVCAGLDASARALEGADPLNRRPHIMGSLAAILVERGDHAEALQLWEAVRSDSRVISAPALADATFAWCAFLCARAGRLEEAEAELAQHRRLDTGVRSFISEVAPAAVAALRGDTQAVEAATSAGLAMTARGPVLLRYWTGAALVGALGSVGMTNRAQEVLAETLWLMDDTYPAERGRMVRGRLLALRAWLEHLEGRHGEASDSLAAAADSAGDALPHVLRCEWRLIEPVFSVALERGTLDASTAMSALDDAFPGGLELVPFLEHPAEDVRRAALRPAARSGDPAAARAAESLPLLSPALRVEVLGRFSVGRGSWRAADADWYRPIDARLVRFLVTRLNQAVPEDLIFEALWPDLGLPSARRSLQVAASRARKLVDRPGAPASIIRAGERSYGLIIEEPDSVDAERFRGAAATALAAQGDARPALLERAHELWTGEPLPAERYSDWARSYREGLLDLHVAVLTALVEIHGHRSDHRASAEAARELVDTDPLNEAGHRALIAAYARMGRTGHALRQFLECRRTLVDELGVEPSDATCRLQARVLAGEAL